MRLVLVAAPLLISATAFAQAPGETDPTDPTDPAPTYSQPPPATAPLPPPAPVIDNPCGSSCGQVNPMARRFAVGLNFGGLSVSDPDVMDGTDTSFHTTELSIRYRMTPHFELELLLSGGRQTLEDNTDGDLAMGGGTLAARYRFRPDRAWNWWLMGGLGATVIERHDATQDERDNAQRPHVAFGIGLERRFSWLALHADLRMIALGERADAADLKDTPTTDPVPVNPTAPDPRTAQQLSGGQFTLGASLYF